MEKKVSEIHNEWLKLIEISGPFLSLKVMMEIFPQGLAILDSPEMKSNLRTAYSEWQESKSDTGIHHLWIKFILNDLLNYQYNDSILLEGQAIPEQLRLIRPSQSEIISPDFVLKNPDDSTNRMLIKYYPDNQNLESAVKDSYSSSSPIDVMIELCRVTGVKLGLVTNGEAWALVHAPIGENSSFAIWYSNLWIEEPVTLRAFLNLLGIHRFFGVSDNDKLEQLFIRSAEDQQEVTDQLGRQVKEAVEILVRTFDRIDLDLKRQLLKDTSESEIYEAALSIMMRLVLMFCAEERGLFPLNNQLYNSNYALSALRAQLRENADKKGEEVLERHHDAWARLLATFRMVHTGVRHEYLELPAYGGSLFNPDRFPFLEGRAKDTKWTDKTSNPPSPLPVDNRTVLHLLEALQVLRINTGSGKETRYLSFRALDPEQIGHVYEGLLDHTVKKAQDIVLGIVGTTKKGSDIEPEIELSVLEKYYEKSEDELLKFLKEKTGKSETALKKLLDKKADFNEYQLLKSACYNNEEIFSRVEMFSGFIRKDTFENYYIVHSGGFFVTEGTDRRSTGTHYTPRSLSEPVVRYTLEPLVYKGVAEGKPESEWELKSPREILDLKICDIAMGSGAFLVQSCRYLAEKLVESWGQVYSPQPSLNHREGEYISNSSQEGDSSNEDSKSLRGTKQSNSNENENTMTKSNNLEIDNDETTSHAFVVISKEHESQKELLLNQSLGSESLRGTKQSQNDESERIGAKSNNLETDSNETTSHAFVVTGSETESLRGTKQSQENETGGLRNNQNNPELELRTISPITVYGELSQGNPNEHLVPTDNEEKLIFAKRLVATHCLYGVDKNQMAVEMAKLSMWLTTLDQNKPFTFLDHNLRCGDSLLGIADIEQIQNFHLNPEKGLEIHKWVGGIRVIAQKAVDKAIELRKRIENLPAFDINGIQEKEYLLKQAEEATQELKLYADLLVGAGLKTAGKKSLLDGEIQDIGALVENALKYDEEKKEEKFKELRDRAKKMLGVEPVTGQPRKAFHWILEFPEVFIKETTSHAFVVTNSEHESQKELLNQSLDSYSLQESSKLSINSESLRGTKQSNINETESTSIMSNNLETESIETTSHAFVVTSKEPESLRGTKQSQNLNTGFDGIVGNPPFLGGQKITGTQGTDYRDYVIDNIANEVKGSADLCSYFFLRISKLINDIGSFGLIATNTIAQGDTREVGLDQIVKDDFKIIRAVQSQKWPGAASLEVALVWAKGQEWNNKYILDNNEVKGITPYLTEVSDVSGKPYRLKANENKSFQGSIVLGMGFVLTPEEAKELVYKNPKNKDVIFPYLNGEDLNSSPTQEPSRWVINFFDWPLNRETAPDGYDGSVASDYPDCLSIVEQKVKPERTRVDEKGEFVLRKPLPQKWWIYGEKRPLLYSTIKDMDRVLAISLVTHHTAFAFEDSNQVFAHRLAIFPFNSFNILSIIQSNFHEIWARKYSSSLETRINYSPSDCFETFPFPQNLDLLEEIGEKYYLHRQSIMQKNQEGLTKTYNRFHSEKEKSPDIVELRQLHIEMDKAVAKAYGWDDLDLDHGFHQTKQGIRFTVSETARREILDRLLRLNHERYAEEVAQGLHDKKLKKEASKPKPKKPKKEIQENKNLSLFDI